VIPEGFAPKTLIKPSQTLLDDAEISARASGLTEYMSAMVSPCFRLEVMPAGTRQYTNEPGCEAMMM